LRQVSITDRQKTKRNKKKNEKGKWAGKRTRKFSQIRNGGKYENPSRLGYLKESKVIPQAPSM